MRRLVGSPIHSPVQLVVRSNLGAGGYLAESLALFARFTTTPTATRKGQINTLIRSLKTAGVWSKLDALYIMAAADSQAATRNWVADTFNLTALGGGAPTFVVDRGATGSGGTAGYDSNFNPTTAVSPKFTQNDAHIGAFVISDANETLNDVGLDSMNTRLRARVGTEINWRLNTATTVTPTGGNIASAIGHTVVTRSSSSASLAYKDGVAAYASQSSTSQASTNATIALATSTKQLSVVHIGSNLSAAEIAAMNTAIRVYLTGVGALS